MTELTVLLVSKTSAEWQALMDAQDIICGPIADYDMVMESPQLKHNGLIVNTFNAIAGSVKMPGLAVGDKNAQSRVRYGPPALGKHISKIILETHRLAHRPISNKTTRPVSDQCGRMAQ